MTPLDLIGLNPIDLIIGVAMFLVGRTSKKSGWTYLFQITLILTRMALEYHKRHPEIFKNKHKVRLETLHAKVQRVELVEGALG